MAYPDLPTPVKGALADEEMRVHHHLWHLVRSREAWNGLTPQQRQQLAAEGWQAPRFEREAGGGIDFLGMHREMIAHANHLMMHADDPSWPRVVGWDPIPWADDDADWPVPNWAQMPPSAQWAREPATAAQMRTIAEQRFTNAAYLRTVTLDQLGTAIEFSIHGWMHIRWSEAEPDVADESDPAYDWLYIPWSSHVNRHFWKLHGWIDDRIGDWEAANETNADLSQAWSGPSAHGHVLHHANKALMRHVPPRNTLLLPMRVDEAIIEAVLNGRAPGADGG